MSATAYAVMKMDRDDASAPLDMVNEIIVIRARPHAITLAAGTGNNQIGTYFDGALYETSTVFTGTLNPVQVIVIHRTDPTRERIMNIWMPGISPPVAASYGATWTSFLENGTDTGTAVQGKFTYYKYQLKLCTGCT